MRREPAVDGGVAAAGVRTVHHVVVDQRAGVQQLQRCGRRDDLRRRPRRRRRGSPSRRRSDAAACRRRAGTRWSASRDRLQVRPIAVQDGGLFGEEDRRVLSARVRARSTSEHRTIGGSARAGRHSGTIRRRGRSLSGRSAHRSRSDDLSPRREHGAFSLVGTARGASGPHHWVSRDPGRAVRRRAARGRADLPSGRIEIGARRGRTCGSGPPRAVDGLARPVRPAGARRRCRPAAMVGRGARARGRRRAGAGPARRPGRDRPVEAQVGDGDLTLWGVGGRPASSGSAAGCSPAAT